MSRRSKNTVGIIGLGIIGQRVSENLRRRGFSVYVWNRTPRPFPNFVGSAAEIAQLTDYIQIFVSDDAALLTVVQQLKMTLKAHHIVMAHCTVAPHTMRAAAEIVQRRGAQFLDAPFTGSKLAAEKGELVFYIGGDDAAFRRARPILEASSKEIVEIGEIGQATTIKIATNMVTAATVQVAAEALALVQSTGVGLDKFAAAMRGNASNSATLTMKLPKMISGDFEPHFSVKHMLKDVQIATRLARSHGLSLGATEAAAVSLREEVGKNRGDYDYTSMVRALIPAEPKPTEPVAAEPELPLLNLKDAPPLEKPVTEERILPEAEAEVAEKPIPVVGPVAASQNDDVPPILPAATTTPLVEVAPVIEPVSTKTGPELATEATVESSAELKTDPISEPTPDLKAEAKVEPITEPAMQSSVPQAEDKAETDPILETKEIQNEPLVILESNHRAWHEDLLDLDEAPATGRKSEAEKPAPWNLDEATKEPKIHEKSAILPEEFEEVSAAQNEPPMVAAVRPIALEQRLPQEAKRPVRVEPPAPEEERRGFFSRMFGKTTPERNSDY